MTATTTTALAQETANKLLDFNAKLDIGLLDRVVSTLYSGSGEEQKVAQEVLTTLKEHPDAWTKVEKNKERLLFSSTLHCIFTIRSSTSLAVWKEKLPKDLMED